jgi:hypothetical protein
MAALPHKFLHIAVPRRPRSRRISTARTVRISFAALVFRTPSPLPSARCRLRASGTSKR